MIPGMVLKEQEINCKQIGRRNKMKDLQLSMLQILFQNHWTSIDNIVLKNKEEIEERKSKAKDMELKTLQELIDLRDSVISQTKKQLSLSKMELIFEEDALESADLISKRMKMSFPSLSLSNSTSILNSAKNRNYSVNVRIENKGDGVSVTDSNLISNKSPIISTLKPLKPIIRNNYLGVNKNLRYSHSPNTKKGLSQFNTVNDGSTSNVTSLPNINVQGIEKPKLERKPSIIIGQHPRKPYLNIKGPRKMFDKPPSPSGGSITSERTTTSLPYVIRSDTDASSQAKGPIPFQSAIKTMKKKSEIKAKDKQRLEKFKKENFIYSASNKKLTLAEKYKPIISPARDTPSNYLSRVDNPPYPNIVKMEEKKEGSSIPVLSHSDRMKNNIQRLNMLSLSDISKPRAPLKGILKKNISHAPTISQITPEDLKANTLATVYN